jgi:hypothetical protein
MALANGASPATSAATEGGAQKIVGCGKPDKSFKSSTTQNQASPADAPAVFELRAWARARLWAAGELDLHDAVDELQAGAERDGLIDRIGQDAVQAIMATAFAPFRGARQ